ncbi:antibiotic biosynthesis monooxygenase [Haloferax sp. Atlit-4N]|uniref:antibiotic biosynthesis monooxygenase family protein n=1 Tax=unclassified Haloferax TaxID=2625095 RepID=UPI000E234DD6|nr:antibiotic biosynthesis monooxygenase [Haloferax sp. Atlit-19N]RDZ49960.1 antibiotic biosynthesis monooxygenase [Haloferax sp. Atlit-4N]
MTYLITFRLDPGEYDAEFHELNDAIQTAAEETEGYLGKQTWHAPNSEEVLVVYYWESLDAVKSFGADSDHQHAKQRWTKWYDAYEVTVTEVVETYGRGFGDEANPLR